MSEFDELQNLVDALCVLQAGWNAETEHAEYKNARDFIHHYVDAKRKPKSDLENLRDGIERRRKATNTGLGIHSTELREGEVLGYETILEDIRIMLEGK